MNFMHENSVEKDSMFSEDFKRWLKMTTSLRLLRRCIENFVEKETETYHCCLLLKILKEDWVLSPQVPEMCAACVPWRDEILANHRLEEAPVHWNNCIPHLWPYEKWEVAKVYMPGGQRIKCSFDKFDITALLNLMANCNHFRAFVETQKLLQVNEVRNIATHAPDMTVSEEDLKKYLVKIKDLGRALEPHAPRLRRLSTETDRLRKMLDSPEQESGVRCFAASFDVMSEWDAERFSLTERTEFLLQCYQEEQLDGLKEAVQGTVKYLEHSEKLKAILGRELSKLRWIQKQLERLEQDTKYQ